MKKRGALLSISLIPMESYFTRNMFKAGKLGKGWFGENLEEAPTEPTFCSGVLLYDGSSNPWSCKPSYCQSSLVYLKFRMANNYEKLKGVVT